MQARDGSNFRVSPGATRAARPFDRIPSGVRPEEPWANANGFPLTRAARHHLHLCREVLALFCGLYFCDSVRIHLPNIELEPHEEEVAEPRDWM